MRVGKGIFVKADLGLRPHPRVNGIDFTSFGTHFPDDPSAEFLLAPELVEKRAAP